MSPPIALMRVFLKAIVLTTKPRIDAYVLFTSKRDLEVRTIVLRKTRISATNDLATALISVKGNFPLQFCNYEPFRLTGLYIVRPRTDLGPVV